VVTSISAGAVTTGTPPAIWKEQLPSGTRATSRRDTSGAGNRVVRTR
jgi:hypothetical protein